MKILLVYPKYPDTFWSFKHALKFISKKASFPPLGLLTVGAMLPKECKKRLIDMNVSDDEELIQLMVKAGFKKVFIGIETPNEESLTECNKYLNKNRDLIACVRKIQDIRALFKSIWFLGIKGKERFHYWKLISWTLVRRPRFFSLAISFAIYGFHFRKIVEI